MQNYFIYLFTFDCFELKIEQHKCGCQSDLFYFKQPELFLCLFVCETDVLITAMTQIMQDNNHRHTERTSVCHLSRD